MINKACLEEVNELYKQYLAREEAIKKAWLEKHPEKMIRGSIAPIECRALWEEFVDEAKEIEKKYNQRPE